MTEDFKGLAIGGRETLARTQPSSGATPGQDAIKSLSPLLTNLLIKAVSTADIDKLMLSLAAR